MTSQGTDYADDPVFYEEFTLNAAQDFIAQIMEESGVTKAELATRLGKTKGAISRLLSDNRNLTMKSFGRIRHGLGMEIRLSADPIKGHVHAPGQRVSVLDEGQTDGDGDTQGLFTRPSFAYLDGDRLAEIKEGERVAEPENKTGQYGKGK